MKERLKTIRAFIIARPVNVLIWKIYCKIFDSKIPDTKSWISLIENKKGLEIGGPSGIFSSNNYFPVYPFVKLLDGVNFSNKTIWEGNIEQGNNYIYGGKIGFQFIAEGTELEQIKSGAYDFVLSSNNLEHIANPIKALFEWKRVIKSGGSLILVLPRKESNFDNIRPITSFEHIENDYKNKINENDLTHLDEIFQSHNLRRDPYAGSFDEFRKRSLNNFENRSLHHHVFDLVLLQKLINYIDMKVLLVYSSSTDHFIAAVK